LASYNFGQNNRRGERPYFRELVIHIVKFYNYKDLKYISVLNFIKSELESFSLKLTSNQNGREEVDFLTGNQS
jgi:hypothetical protein